MSKYIADFILYKEYECSCCRRLPPEFYYNGGGRVDSPPYLYRELFDSFKTIREKWGRAIPIGKWGKDGGYRCLKRQGSLYDQEISTAYLSVHNFGLAIDMDFDNEEDVRSMVKLIKIHCPELRIGWKGYLYKGQTFIHIDTGYRIRPIYSKKLYRGNEW